MAYDIGALIAGTGGITPPKFDFQSAIGNLPNAYWDGLEQAYKQRNRDLFRDGVPTDAAGNPDLNAAYTKILQAGGAPAMNALNGISDQQGQALDRAIMGRLYPQGGTSAAPTAATPSLTEATPSKAAPTPGARPQVQTDVPASPPNQRVAQTSNTQKYPDPSMGGKVPKEHQSDPGGYALTLRAYAAAITRSGKTGSKERAEMLIKHAEAIDKAMEQAGEADRAGDKASAEGMAKQYNELYKTFADAGRNAYKSLGSLNLMENAIKDKNFYSGFGDDQTLQLKKFAVWLNWNPDGVSSMETFKAEGNRNVLNTLGSLGPGVSNGDRDFIVESFPSLKNTPTGNAMMISIARDIAKRQIDVARMANEYQRRNGKLDAGFESQLDAWSQKNPMFSEKRMQEIRAAATETIAKKSGKEAANTYKWKGPSGRVYDVIDGKLVK